MIYLDHNATTPLDPRVLETLLPYLKEQFGNASSSTHPYGWAAKEAVEAARKQVASLLGASSREIIFTSGATEADNIAIFGAALASTGRNHIVSQVTEHPAVADPLDELRRRGFEVTQLATDATGWLTPDRVASAITEKTCLVTIMAANNEVGTVFPIAEIGRICKEAGVLFHTDAAQAVGKVPLDVEAMGIDLLSLSAHKFYGPKGCGALYVRAREPRVRLQAISYGGGQENKLRPGTLNVPGIVGLGEASRIVTEELDEESSRIRQLRDLLHERLTVLDGVVLNGHPEQRLPGTLSVSFSGVDGGALLLQLRDVAVSSGSACSSGNNQPSKILKALGISDKAALSTIRFAVGRFNTTEEIERAAESVTNAVRQLRGQRLR